MDFIRKYILAAGRICSYLVSHWLLQVISAVVTIMVWSGVNSENYVAVIGITVIFWAVSLALTPMYGGITNMPTSPVSGHEYGVYDAKAEVWNVEEWTPAGGYRKYQVAEKNPPLGD